MTDKRKITKHSVHLSKTGRKPTRIAKNPSHLPIALHTPHIYIESLHSQNYALARLKVRASTLFRYTKMKTAMVRSSDTMAVDGDPTCAPLAMESKYSFAVLQDHCNVQPAPVTVASVVH